MHKAIQLTTAISVAKYWDFIRKGLNELADKGKERYDQEELFKTACWLATTPTFGWVGLVLTDGKPSGFAILVDSTPLFSKKRSFTARAFWHQSGSREATLELMRAFEYWAFQNDIKQYTVTTRRDSGAAIRCFQSEEYGFKKQYITFVKHL